MNSSLPRVVALLCVIWGLATLSAVTVNADSRPLFEVSHPTFDVTGSIAIPCTAYRATDDTIFCAFMEHDGTSAIDIGSTRDGGRHWSKAVRVMACPGEGYIADPTVLVCPNGVSVFATYVPKDPSGAFARSHFLRSDSPDGTKDWTPPREIKVPHQYVSGKTHAPVWLDDRHVVMGYSYDLPADRKQPVKLERQMYSRAGVLISDDAGLTWAPGGDVFVNILPTGADEPALLKLKDGSLFMVVRTSAPHPYESLSRDGGKTWDAPHPSALSTYNAPTALLRLNDGAVLRVWDNSDRHRYPLVAAISTDECKTWSPPRTIIDRVADASGKMPFDTACYPSMAQSADGTIVLVWWEQDGKTARIGSARFNRAWLESDARDVSGPK